MLCSHRIPPKPLDSAFSSNLLENTTGAQITQDRGLQDAHRTGYHQPPNGLSKSYGDDCFVFLVFHVRTTTVS